MLREHFPEVKATILATDIDETILNKAKQGIYDSKALKDLPVHKKSKYFVYQDDQYHIVEDLKKNITFKKHDRSEEHTSELQSRGHLVCRLLLEKKNIYNKSTVYYTD